MIFFIVEKPFEPFAVGVSFRLSFLPFLFSFTSEHVDWPLFRAPIPADNVMYILYGA